MADRRAERPWQRVALLAGVLAATATVSGAVHVAFLSPSPGQPLFGVVEIVADIEPPGDVVRVDFIVDGDVVGSLDEPPFAISVDVGQENREHVLGIRVLDVNGAVEETTLTSSAIRVDGRVDARLQQLYITVLDGEERVLDLVQADFEVTDNGAVQDPVTFSRGDVPLAAVILVDASSSMRGRRLRFALRGAASFAERMKPEDETSIQLFADRLLFSSSFSNDARGLTSGLASVEASGGTALIDYLYRAFKQLEARQGRRVVILLSDGVDSHSTLRMQDVSWLSRRSRSMLYWIRIDPSDGTESRYSSWKDPHRYRNEFRLLEETVTETGGRIVTLERIEDAEDAVQEILRELREQYVIGYYPSTRHSDGSWHRVGVRVRRSTLRVRARGGYVDY